MGKFDFNKYTIEQITSNTNKIPDVIFSQYILLYEMLKENNYYGAFLQIKDVLELAIKFPILIMLAIAEKEIMNKDGEHYVEPSKNIREKYVNLDEFVYDVLSCEISFGALERFAKGLANLDASMAPSKYKAEFLKVQELLNKIYRCYYNPYGLEKGENISSWRNRDIGHGAVDSDEKRVKESVEILLRNLNAIMKESDYSQIKVLQDNETYFVSTDDSESKLLMESYLKVNSGFSNGNYQYSYLFESFNIRNRKAKLLDYVHNHKCVHNGLSRILSILVDKLNAKPMSENKVEADFINKSDEEEVLRVKRDNLIPFDAFIEETKCLLAKKKGVLHLQSERGTGKSVFSRLIINNYSEKRGSTHKLLFSKEKYNKRLASLLGETEKKLYVCTYNFNNAWMYSREHFTESLIDSLYPDTSSDVRYNKARRKFERLFIDDRPENAISDSEYRTELSSAFNSWLEVSLERFSGNNVDAKLLLVLDGIDEIPIHSDAVNIVEFLNEAGLPENVYVLLLSRTESEWKIPQELLQCGFETKKICKSRFDVSLKKYIDASLYNPTKETVNYIISKADNRILYVSAICDICNMIAKKYQYINPSLEAKEVNEIIAKQLMENSVNFVVEYLETFKIISEKYCNKLKRLLCVLSALKNPVRLDELYFLFNSVGDLYPDFLFLGMLRDLKGFITIDRVDGKNLYSIANEEWKMQLRDDYFHSVREEIVHDLSTFLKETYLDSESCLLNDFDILAINYIMDNGKIDSGIALIVFCNLEHDSVNASVEFSKRFNFYYSFTKHISKIYQDSDFYGINCSDEIKLTTDIMFWYSKLLIDTNIGKTRASRDINKIEEFKLLLDEFGGAFGRIDTISKGIFDRIMTILSNLLINMYYNCNCANDLIYGYMYVVIKIWTHFILKYNSPNMFVLYDVLACMISVSKDKNATIYNEFEGGIIKQLGEDTSVLNKACIEVLEKRIEFANALNTLDMAKIEHTKCSIESSLMDLLNRTKNDDSIEEAKWDGFLSYVQRFYFPFLKKTHPVSVLRLHVLWQCKLISQNYVSKRSNVLELDTVSCLFFGALEMDLKDCYIEFLEIMNSVQKCINDNKFDYSMSFLFYNQIVSISAAKISNLENINSSLLGSYISEFESVYDSVKNKNIVYDVYIPVSYYVKMASFALDFQFYDIADKCIDRVYETCDDTFSNIDNSFSKVGEALIENWIFELKDSVTRYDNKLLMIKYCKALVTMYQYLDFDSAETVEKCCLDCFKMLVDNADIMNFNTKSMLFNRFVGGEYYNSASLTIDEFTIYDARNLVPHYGFAICDEDTVGFNSLEQFVDYHSILRISPYCFFERSKFHAEDCLYELIMNMEDDDYKREFAEGKLKVIKKLPGLVNNFYEYQKSLKASQICNEYNTLISLCTNIIHRDKRYVFDEESCKRNGKQYVEICLAYYHRALCYKDINEMSLYECDMQEFEKLAALANLTKEDFLKAEFDVNKVPLSEIQFLKKPLFGLPFGGIYEP